MTFEPGKEPKPLTPEQLERNRKMLENNKCCRKVMHCVLQAVIDFSIAVAPKKKGGKQ